MNDIVSPYARVLGDVIRGHRKGKGWTRKDLQVHLDADISTQTLATYELATRDIPGSRLVELAAAFGVLPHVLLAGADRRMYPPSDKVVIDLAALAQATRPDLAPVARWAAVQLHGHGGTPPIAEWNHDALNELARLCDLAVPDLSGALHDFHYRGHRE